MHFATRAISSIDGKVHKLEVKSSRTYLFNLSHKVHITPLVI